MQILNFVLRYTCMPRFWELPSNSGLTCAIAPLKKKKENPLPKKHLFICLFYLWLQI